MATALYEEARKITNDPVAKKQLLDESEYYADKSLAIYPTYGSANQIKSGLVAERYLRDGDYNKLLAEFTKILDAKPRTEYIPQFLEYINEQVPQEVMIDFYYKTGYELLSKIKQEFSPAITILKIGEKLAPNDQRILFALGKTFYEAGDQVQGTQYLERAYQQNPALRDVK